MEKAVANFDEDSITMAVAAGFDCLCGFDRTAVDGLLFATTTSPYIEKQGAATVAAAVDLRKEILTSDITNSLRAGTLAMRSALDAIKAGSAKQVMVTASDCRTGAPGSEVGTAAGHGAAALLLGNEGVIAEVLDSYSVSEELIDLWRAEGDSNVRSWEDRFVYDTGYLKVMPDAISGLMKKMSLEPKDITTAAFYGPTARRHTQMAGQLGLDPNSQVVNPLFDQMGNTGTGYALMLLISALEEAKEGDKILVASYGDGADAYLLEVTGEIGKLPARRGMKGYLGAKSILPNTGMVGTWQNARTGGLAGGPPSVSARYREREEINRLHAGKCTACGLVQFPKQRICSRCHTKDEWEAVTLADKKGKVFTFSLDHVAGAIDRPLAITVINFDGGGRGMFMMTDRLVEEVKCEAPVEMSFRKLRSSGGVHNYYWKSVPLRV
jgi:3-hydroxy-3-methylglutaryl CoA synthase/uncharacterized OB-fold protein